MEGNIDFFIVDEDNFNRYRDGMNFNCYNYMSGSEGDIVVNSQENNWYLVFRNNGRSINIILNFSVTVEMSTYDLTRGRIVYRHKKGQAPPPSAAAEVKKTE